MTAVAAISSGLFTFQRKQGSKGGDAALGDDFPFHLTDQRYGATKTQ